MDVAVFFNMNRFLFKEDIHVKADSGRQALAGRGTAAAQSKAQASITSGTQTHYPSTSPDRYFVRAAYRDSLGGFAAGNGLRIGCELLAAPGGMATRGSVDTATPGAAHPLAGGRANRVVAHDCRQFIRARYARGKKTGPNPTDRRKAGSKHHLITDARGIPLATILTPANAHDVTQLLPLVSAIKPLHGRCGRPRRRPDRVQGDRAYDSAAHRRALRAKGICPMLAKRRTAHGSGLGKTRWVVERSIAWLHQFRRLKMRYERLHFVHEAFLSIACSMICWKFIQTHALSF
jgi:transposase